MAMRHSLVGRRASPHSSRYRHTRRICCFGPAWRHDRDYIGSISTEDGSESIKLLDSKMKISAVCRRLVVDRLRRTQSRSVVSAQGGAVEREALPCFDPKKNNTLLCSSLTASTKQGMFDEAKEAEEAGADVVEIRLDFLQDFDAERDLEDLIKGVRLPCIITYRPKWEGGQYGGEEAPRLATLKLAMELGAAYIDVEFLVAPVFMAAIQEQRCNYSTKVIVSSHDYESTVSDDALKKLIAAIREVGADVVKFATTGLDISDGNRVLSIVKEASTAGPVIGLCMGEKGQATRILAPKYGGYLTFGALSPERQSAPGQPTIDQLKRLYRLDDQNKDTKVLGIVGNPVSHSKSPAIHNAALAQSGLDYVYIPLLVDDFEKFLASLPDEDWVGLSVTVPHKMAALGAAREADVVATSIAAANTLVRLDSGGFKAYNTDWLAAISSIESAMDKHGLGDGNSSPLNGKQVVVIGAGGAGRALAFGAASRGAKVIVANRTADKAKQLAEQLHPKGLGVSLEELQQGCIQGDVLVNTTSVGMQPRESESPLPESATAKFSVVFDAVYTPLHTKLLQDAKKSGAIVVTGEKMFVGQAAEQYRLFTGKSPDVALMTDVVMGKVKP
jgi:3-dehydroquinate dehydratase/shikimate dehydrogenase